MGLYILIFCKFLEKNAILIYWYFAKIFGPCSLAVTKMTIDSLTDYHWQPIVILLLKRLGSFRIKNFCYRGELK